MDEQDRERFRALLGELTTALARHLATAARVARRLRVVATVASILLLLVVAAGWPPTSATHWAGLGLLALLVAQPPLTLWRLSVLLDDLARTPWAAADVPAAAERALDRVAAIAQEARGEGRGLRSTIRLVRDLRAVQDELETEIPGLAQLLELADPARTTQIGVALAGVPVIATAVPLAALAAVVT